MAVGTSATFNITVGPIGLSITRGWNASEDFGTTADYYVDASVGSSGAGTTPATAFKTVQEAVNASVTDATARTIAIIDGTYREEVDLTSIAAPLTLKGYGTDKPLITGFEQVTGWTQCTSGDQGRVGANYASIYKVNVAASTLAVDHQAICMYEGDTPVPLCQTQTGDKFFSTNDKDFLRADSFTLNGSNQITAIVDADVLDGLTATNLTSQAFVNLYHSANSVSRVNITGYNDSTDTITVDGLKIVQGNTATPAADNLRWNLVNHLPNLTVGTCGAFDEGDSTVTLYIWPNSAANLTSNIQVAARTQIIDADGIGNLTFQGLQLLGVASNQRENSQCISLRTSANTPRSGATVQHCKLGRMYNTDGAFYGAIYAELIDDVEVSNCEFEYIDGGFGMFASGNASTSDLNQNGVFTRNKARYIAQAPFRFYAQLNCEFSYNDVRYTGKAGHANALNFYEQCDLILIKGNWFRDHVGYVTWQEASRLFVCDNVIAIGDQTNVGFLDQANPTAPPTTGSTFYVWNNAFLPNKDDTTVDAVNVGKSWVDLGVADADHPYNNVYQLVNNIIHGGGVSEPYGTPPSGGEHWADRTPPVDTEPNRVGNLYTKLDFWQGAGYGWALDATEDTQTTLSSVYTGATSGDFTAPGGSKILTHTAQSVSAIVTIAETAFPNVRFDVDGNGKPISGTRAVGPFEDWNTEIATIGFDAATP